MAVLKKTEIEQEAQLDLVFTALSDSTRRKMLHAISRAELSVKEIGEPLGISKQLASKHLKVLESSGLIQKRKDGRVQKCQYRPEVAERVQQVIEEYQQFWDQQLDVLNQYVEEKMKQKGKKK